jgi:glutathione S-transferase
MQLVVGNKRYSSWSLRPWLALRVFEIPFEERVLPLGTPEFAAGIGELSGSRRVPVLIDGDVRVWESLAILETLAERFPERAIWPADPAARALARAISSEMHAGFSALRSACPMNLQLEAPFQGWGGPATADDVRRIVALWADARECFGIPSGAGPFLFGAFTAADAMFAPVTTRLTSYGWPIDARTRAYCDAVQALPAFREWKAAAEAEPWVLPGNEVQAAKA